MSKYKNDEYRAKHAAWARDNNKKNKDLVRERHKRYRTKNPEKYKLIQKNADLHKLYGITLEERDLILQSQNGRCAICRTDDPGKRGWFTDHCHTVNKVRGILCQHCNSVLGYAKDDTAILKAAIVYLRRGLLI